MKLPLPPLGFAASVTLPPVQKVVGPPGVMVTLTVLLTLTEVAGDVAEHPAALVIVTV